jgi:hypothetical protein
MALDLATTSISQAYLSLLPRLVERRIGLDSTLAPSRLAAVVAASDPAGWSMPSGDGLNLVTQSEKGIRNNSDILSYIKKVSGIIQTYRLTKGIAILCANPEAP